MVWLLLAVSSPLQVNINPNDEQSHNHGITKTPDLIECFAQNLDLIPLAIQIIPQSNASQVNTYTNRYLCRPRWLSDTAYDQPETSARPQVLD